MDKCIELKVRKRKLDKNDRRCVQIDGKADAVLMELYRATGLPLGYIVSQMIIQGAPFVEITEVQEEG